MRAFILLAALLAACPALAQEPGEAADQAAAAALPQARILPLEAQVLGLELKVLRIEGVALGTEAAVVDLAAAARALAGRVAGLEVRVDDTAVRLSLQGDVLFDFDQASIRPDAERALLAVAELAAKAPAMRVEGHTDAKGSAAYNQRLSERRALAVAEWLAGHGIAPARLASRGFGESRPVAANALPNGGDDPAGRQRNRRVEIVLDR